MAAAATPRSAVRPWLMAAAPTSASGSKFSHLVPLYDLFSPNLGCPTLRTGWPFPCQPVADIRLLRAGRPTAPSAVVQRSLCPPWHRQDPGDAEVCMPHKRAPAGAAPPPWAEGPGWRGLTWATDFGARALAGDHSGNTEGNLGSVTLDSEHEMTTAASPLLEGKSSLLSLAPS